MRFESGAVRAAACAVGLLLGAAGLPAEAAPAEPPKTYDTVNLGEGVDAFISTKKSGFANANTLLVVGDDAALVVDSGISPSIARQIIADIRRKTDKPVRYLVNTHWHEDHWVADNEYRKAFPDIVIVSTEFTRERVQKEIPEAIQKMIANAQAESKNFEEALARGTRKDGTPLDDAARKKYQDVIDDMAFSQTDFRQAGALVSPDLTFEQGIRLYLGKREVRVSFLGLGNTGGDAVTYVPDAKVVAAGDLVVLPTPFSLGSYPKEWIETLRKLSALDTVALVPGHGPVQRDQTYVNMLIRLLQSVVTQVAEAVRSGATLEETRTRVHLDDLEKELTKGDAKLDPMFQAYFVVPAVERAYQEAKGAYGPE